MEFEHMDNPGLDPQCEGCANRTRDTFPIPLYPCKAVSLKEDETVILPERKDNICLKYRPNLVTFLRSLLHSPGIE